jgi:pimeloyl-ACP methyl ester carboxylesterase
MACSSGDELPEVSTGGEHFFDAPWPDDNRTVNGRPDMSGFPQSSSMDLIAQYLEQIEQLDGFGTNSPIYIPLDRRPNSLPSASETINTDSPVLLIDIDPQSPERGRLIPLTFRYQSEATNWYRANTLAIQPVWGFPLRPRTTHALVLNSDFVQSVSNGAPSSELVETLQQLRIDDADVAFHLQFTTQDPVGEMARFEARIASDLTVQELDQELPRFVSNDDFGGYEGTMWVPMWQHGTKPYLASGGGFQFDEHGMPILAAWEEVKFTLSVPANEEPPANGWPVVIYGHGTGGSSRGFASGTNPLSPARMLARMGIAGFGISLPLHGDRGTGVDPALVSFNYLNPESARACFRQGALDQVYLAEMLSARSHAFGLPDGRIARTDPDRLAYMGHSHGGLIGAMAAPFFGDRIKGVFLSGAGGGLSTTVVTRDAGDFDIQGLLQSTLSFGAEDDLVQSHPVIAAVQTLAEVTDPINYAPYWSEREPFWAASPQSVLMTEGLNDVQTPPATAEALAAAGMLPLIAPAANVSTAHRLIGGGTDPAPIRGNRLSWDGARVTGGLAQYGNDDHFAIFNNDNAAALYQAFLYTALEGETPWIQELQ